MPMQIVSRLFKKQGDTDSKNDGSPKPEIYSEDYSTSHPVSHLRRWKSAKTLNSLRRSYSTTFKKFHGEENTQPEIPPLPDTPRHTDTARKNISNPSDRSAGNESSSTMQNSKRFLVFYRLEDGESGLTNKTMTRRRRKQPSTIQPQPSETASNETKHWNANYSSARLSMSDDGSDSDFDDNGVRDAFKFEKVIARFPRPPEMDGRTIYSLPSSTSNHDGFLGPDEFSLSSVTRSSTEVKDNETGGDGQSLIAGFNDWPSSTSTKPFPTEVDPETLSSKDPFDIDYIKLPEEDFKNIEVQENSHHGRMPSISKMQYWHLPSARVSEPPKSTASQFEGHYTLDGLNQYSRKWDMQNPQTFIKRTKSLANMPRHRYNSNL